jgi:O-antigen/teichoic acid export membrane protein
VLIVPKLIGVEDYGYWQVYLFYVSYVVFMHFGWSDGIYLRYGGKQYKELDKRLFFSQFYILIFSQVIMAMIISIMAVLFLADKNRIFIIQMTALSLVLANTRYMLLYILQATNRVKEYAKITTIGRIVYFILVVSLLFFGVREYKIMIFADLIGRFISLAYAMYFCKDIVFRKVSTFYLSFKEAKENISVGIKLMFSNMASILIIGTVRLGIERSWDVSTFGKISLALSASNSMMLFINAVGIVVFPILKRTDEKKLPRIFTTMRDFLMALLFGALIIYYPLKTVLSMWLPQYASGLMYMALLFPIFVYEGKMALLINTYFKTFRKEKLMMRINLISLILSLFITFITTVLFKNLDIAIVSIVVLLAFRSILAEIFLSKLLSITVYKDIILELMMTLIFILTGWFINSWYTVLIYGIVYLIYLAIKRKDIDNSIKNIKVLMEA